MLFYKMKPFLKTQGIFVMFIGVILILYPYFTNVYAYMLQKSLRMNMVNLQINHKSSGYHNFTQALLEIPSIKLSTVVLPGISADTLKKSPGWYEQSALPGQGNTAIAGHRTMYGNWFRNLSRLTRGEIIILKYEGISYKYQVESVFKVKNDNRSVIEPCGYIALTLTTCVKGDSGHRLVVRAKILSSLEQST
jgi:sortase A